MSISVVLRKLLWAATKLGQGNFFTGVCHSVNGECVCQVHPPGTRYPPGPRCPPRPRYTHLGPGTPSGPDQVHPPGTRYTPRPSGTRYTPPRTRYTPPKIRPTSGRYASYWNAFLFSVFLFLITLCFLINHAFNGNGKKYFDSGWNLTKTTRRKCLIKPLPKKERLKNISRAIQSRLNNCRIMNCKSYHCY